MSSNQPAKRPGSAKRRLLGDARREAVEAAHFAASKRRRLAGGPDGGDDEPDDDDPEIAPTTIATGALGDDDVAVFADVAYDNDDKEADFIYDAVDSRMESRRQRQRDSVLQQQLKEYRDANPTIREQFSDLKSGLHQVSADAWAAIPDIGDYSVKKHKFQKFTPVPDSLLERARQENAYVASQPSSAGPTTDLAAIGAGRTSVLEHNLDLAGGASSANQTTVDHDGYLAAMTGSSLPSDAEIGDVKKARQLLKSITTTNPTHAPGWVAAARLEEKMGRLSVARSLALDGCRKCPMEEEMWVEAARLHPPDIGRRILARAIRSVPKSLMVWMNAAELETDVDAKRRVLRKALEIIPRSAKLWQAAVELEEPTGARILLTRAVECVPKAVELWLALARLEPYQNAKEVLRRARVANPRVLEVVVTEAQLEEVEGGRESAEIDIVVAQGVANGSVVGRLTGRDEWMRRAEVMDRTGYMGTVGAIVRNASGLGVSEEERESTWMNDAKRYEGEGLTEVARAMHRHLTQTFPQNIGLWRVFADFERRRGTYSDVKRVLSKGVTHCGRAELLWLMLAKEVWKSEGSEAARSVLKRAFDALPDNEAIWVAAAKVESESGEFERGWALLEHARMLAPSARVFMKSALLARQSGKRTKERQFLCQGLDAFPAGEKLWLMLAQWFERGSQQNGHADGQLGMYGGDDGDFKSEVWRIWNARGAYTTGVQRCKKCAALWVGYCRLEERAGAIGKARAVIERGREHCGGTKEEADVVWRESVYLEIRNGKRGAGAHLMARAVQECKGSGRLWALALAMEGRKGQKAKSVDAIKTCPQDAVVILEVAKYIWRTGKIDKAKTWLARSVELDADYGDSWATLHAFERAHGTEESVGAVEAKVDKVEPRHGDMWTAVSKKVGNERMSCLHILRTVSSMVSKESDISGMHRSVSIA